MQGEHVSILGQGTKILQAGTGGQKEKRKNKTYLGLPVFLGEETWVMTMYLTGTKQGRITNGKNSCSEV